MSAPTEQDKARGQEIVAAFFGIQEIPYPASLAEMIAAALQAERERTRAETWSKAVNAALSFDHYMARSVAIEIRNQQNKESE